MSVHLFVYRLCCSVEARDILLAKQCSVCFDAYLICAFALILKVTRSTLTRRVSDLLFCFLCILEVSGPASAFAYLIY